MTVSSRPSQNGRLRFSRVVVVLICVALGAPAVAGACSLSDHCYGYARWNQTNDANNASFAIVTANALSIPDSDICNGFANVELWEGTNNDPYGNTWVETGMKYGLHFDGTCTQLSWFWANNSPQYGYTEHHAFISSALNTPYQLKIVWAGNNSWNLVRDGYTFATASYNPGPSRQMTVGEEVASYFGHVDGTAGTLKWLGTGGTWHNGWNGNTNAFTSATTPWANAGWTSAYTYAWFNFSA